MLGKGLREKTLFHQLKEKDREAFIYAYDKYLDSIYRFIYFKVDNHEEAEDLTSQTFLKIWDYIQTNSIEEYNSLKALLYKTARNCVIDHYRKKAQQANIALDRIPEIDQIVDEKIDIHEQLVVTNEFKIVESAMFELKDEYREVITLRYINELSIAEIAEVLEKNSGNVRVLIFRALNALRELTDKK